MKNFGMNLLNYNSKKSSFTTYISVIIRNVCINYLNNNNTKNKIIYLKFFIKIKIKKG